MNQIDFEHTISYPSSYMGRVKSVPSQPTASAKNETGDFGKFTDFARRIMAVPRSAIQPQLDAEKEVKRTRAAKASASRASDASPKRAT